MAFEQLSNFRQEKEPIDITWYDSFEKVGLFEDYEYLDGKKEKREFQKKDFFDEKIRNPILDYPKLKNFDFETREEGLKELKIKIKSEECNEAVRMAYIWKINEKLATLRMMKAANDGNDHDFYIYSRFIYGSPEQDIFQNELAMVSELIEAKKDDNDLRIRLAVARLKESIPLVNESSLVVNEFKGKGLIKGEFEEKEKKYTSEQVAEIFDWALQNRHLDGWKIIIDRDSSKSAVSVSQEKKSIIIPEKRTMSPTKLHGLIAHEIDTHIMRRNNGERSKLKLLQIGLDRYLPGEEGISTFEEQQIEGADDFAGFEGHFAISLTVGMDGIKRDFRSVYNILRDYIFIKSRNLDKDKAWKNAKTEAWNRCVRTFRGTTCQGKGVCLTRDIVYREGNIKTWHLVKNDPNCVSHFSIGKFDPSNPRHIWIMEKLEISDEDLETLDK